VKRGGFGPGAFLLLSSAMCGVWTAGHARAQAAVDATQAKACFNAAQAAYLAGRLDEAQRGFECAYQQLPSAEMAWNLARVAERMGDVDRGVQYFREYLARAHIAPREQRAVEVRIQKLFDLRARQASVLKDNVETEAALGKQARSFFERGVKLFRRGQYEAAAAAFMAALQASGAPELHYNLALCAERLGHLDEANDYYRAYLAALPNAPDRTQITARMAQLAQR
jgi:tetratricopeptide (TPR) repeat protein